VTPKEQKSLLTAAPIFSFGFLAGGLLVIFLYFTGSIQPEPLVMFYLLCIAGGVSVVSSFYYAAHCQRQITEIVDSKKSLPFRKLKIRLLVAGTLAVPLVIASWYYFYLWTFTV